MRTGTVHKRKKLICLLLMFCMMFSIMPTSVSAEGTETIQSVEGTIVPETETTEEILLETTEEAPLETTEETPPETTTEPEITEESGTETGENTQTGESTQNGTEQSYISIMPMSFTGNGILTATLTGEGNTVNLADTGSEITVNNYTSSTTEQTLKVTESFDGTDITTDKIVVIEFKNGLGLGAAPGMEKGSSNGVWSFNASLLPSELSTIIADGEFIANPVITQISGTTEGSGTTYQPKSGTLVYTLYPATANVSISIGVLSDWAFAMSYVTGKTHSDALTVKTFEAVNVDIDADTPKNTATLEKYILEGTTLIRIQGINSSYQATKTVAVDESWVSEFQIYSRRSGLESSVNGMFLHEKIELKLTVSKSIGVERVNIPSGSGITSNTLNWEIDTTTSGTSDYVKITLTRANLTNAKLELLGKVPTGATPGTYDTYGTSQSFTSTNYTGEVNTRWSLFSWLKILVPEPWQNSLTVQADSSSLLPTVRGDADLKLLGTFRISNKYAAIVSNQMMHVEFDDPNMGVRAVRLPTSSQGAENVVITTTKGTYTFPSLSRVNSILGFGYVQINLNDMTTDDTEYITGITYEMPGDFAVGATHEVNTFRSASNMSFVYFGDILSSSATSFAATATVGEMVDDNGVNKISDTTYTTATTKMTFSTVNGINFSPYTSGMNGQTLKSGNTLTGVSVTFGKSSFAYPDASPSAVKGYYVYLRAPDGILSINRDSIKVTYAGVTYTESDGFFTIAEIEDNTGSTVYRLNLNDVIMGYYRNDFSLYSSVTVTMDIKAEPMAPKIAVPLHEMFMISTINDSIRVYYPSSTSITTHSFNIDDRNNSGLYVGVPTITQSLNIQPETVFAAYTSARLNGEAWKYYDSTDADTIIDLNPDGTAEYGLIASNYSGSAVDGFVALIPIPKYGETAASQLQDNAFGWTASILEEIDLTDMGYNPSDYEVLYSTTYETDKDSVNFVPWSAIINKEDIRMVKIASLNPILDETILQFVFTLEITDPDKLLHEGNTNIYSAYIYRDVAGNAGYVVSEPVAIRLQIGIIKGHVYLDANKNGILDTSEAGVNGVTVRVYDTNTDELLATTTTATRTINSVTVQGYYEFLSLNSGQDVYIVFTNPNTSSYGFSNPGNGQFTIASDRSIATATSVKATTDTAAWAYEHIDCGIVEPYTITFEAGSGIFVSGGSGTQVINAYAGDTVSAPATNPVWLGHNFEGWCTDTTYTTPASFPVSVSGNAIYYAKWTTNSYAVIYKDHSGTDITSLPSAYDGAKSYTYGIGLAIPTTQPYTRTGYTFLGWYTAVTDGSQVTTISTTETGIKTLYARWQINTYNVTYNANGGIGTAPVDITPYTHGSKVTVKGNSDLSKDGYTFTGWNTQVDGQGTFYFTGVGSFTITDNITLYAQWTETTVVNPPVVTTYNVTYNANGGTGTVPVDSINYTTGTTATVLGQGDLEKMGYTFLGWSTDNTATLAEVSEGNTITVIADTQLYAVWQINKYTVTFVSNGGTGVASQSVNYGGTVTRPTAPTRSSYTFVGWYTDNSTLLNAYDFSTSVMVDMDLYAKWRSNDDDDDTSTTEPDPNPKDPTDPVGPGPINPVDPDPKDPVDPDDDDKTSDGYEIGGGSGRDPSNPYDNIIIIGEEGVPLSSLEDIIHIQYLYGYSDGSVKPENAITRAEAASIFYRLLKETYEDIDEPLVFSDVSPDAWYSLAINKLTEYGILNGYTDGTFRPDQPITRAEFATIASKFDRLILTSGTAFSDVPQTHWAVQYINSAYVKGWVGGYPDYSFKPENGISRSEVVTIVNNMLGRTVDFTALAKAENPYNDISSNHWSYADIIEASLKHEYERDDERNEIWQTW